MDKLLSSVTALTLFIGLLAPSGPVRATVAKARRLLWKARKEARKIKWQLRWLARRFRSRRLSDKAVAAILRQWGLLPYLKHLKAKGRPWKAASMKGALSAIRAYLASASSHVHRSNRLKRKISPLEKSLEGLKKSVRDIDWKTSRLKDRLSPIKSRLWFVNFNINHYRQKKKRAYRESKENADRLRQLIKILKSIRAEYHRIGGNAFYKKYRSQCIKTGSHTIGRKRRFKFRYLREERLRKEYRHRWTGVRPRLMAEWRKWQRKIAALLKERRLKRALLMPLKRRMMTLKSLLKQARDRLKPRARAISRLKAEATRLWNAAIGLRHNAGQQLARLRRRVDYLKAVRTMLSRLRRFCLKRLSRRLSKALVKWVEKPKGMTANMRSGPLKWFAAHPFKRKSRKKPGRRAARDRLALLKAQQELLERQKGDELNSLKALLQKQETNVRAIEELTRRLEHGLSDMFFDALLKLFDKIYERLKTIREGQRSVELMKARAALPSQQLAVKMEQAKLKMLKARQQTFRHALSREMKGSRNARRIGKFGDAIVDTGREVEKAAKRLKRLKKGAANLFRRIGGLVTSPVPGVDKLKKIQEYLALIKARQIKETALDLLNKLGLEELLQKDGLLRKLIKKVRSLKKVRAFFKRHRSKLAQVKLTARRMKGLRLTLASRIGRIPAMKRMVLPLLRKFMKAISVKAALGFLSTITEITNLSYAYLFHRQATSELTNLLQGIKGLDSAARIKHRQIHELVARQKALKAEIQALETRLK